MKFAMSLQNRKYELDTVQKEIIVFQMQWAI